MVRIGLLSDTHGFVHPKIPQVFGECDEIWHAGDFGNIEVAMSLRNLKPLRGVFGNIDGSDIRIEYPEMMQFMCESVDVLMIHIGGYPNNYTSAVRKIMNTNAPNLFISGHSHILKVMFDRRYNCLHINPGASGRSGIHQVITMVRFIIEGINIMDIEVIEFPK